MIEARQAIPIDRSSPVAAVRLLWQAMHSDDGANMPCTSGASWGPCAVTVTVGTTNSASKHTAAAGASHLLPPIEESPFVPVPQEVREHLWMAAVAIAHRDLHSAAHQDMAPFAERDLQLRNDIPL